MKRKIVLWGSNEKDEKILVALELMDKDNKVNIYIFDQKVATEDFYNSLLKDWRSDKEVGFPDHQKIERPLTMSDQILPESIKVDRTDIISRAQAEWHFVVLSAKLYQMYKSEVEDITEAVEKMTKYDNVVWNDLKTFWEKVQAQIYDKNLFREHAASLKNRTNELFEKLKVMRKEVNAELDKVSSEHKEKVLTALTDIHGRIEKGQGLKPLFEELKSLQNQIKGMDFSRKHRRQVWDKIDIAFKIIKEKRFGDKGEKSGNSPKDRLERRYNGLLGAIDRMERSVRRDKQDQEWQTKRANTTNGQLEMQIRQAKVKMIDERLKSKVEKLDDMIKTKAELEVKIKKETEREVRKKEKQETDKAKKAAAEVVKAKIAEEMKSNSEQNADIADKLEKAASQIAESKSKKKKVPPVELPKEEDTKPAEKKDDEAKSDADSKTKLEEEVTETIDKIEEKITEVKGMAEDIFGAIAMTIGETIEDVVDTVKAVAEVVEDRIEDAVESFKSEEEE